MLLLPKWAQLVLVGVSLFSESQRECQAGGGALAGPPISRVPASGPGLGLWARVQVGRGASPPPPEPLVHLFFIASILCNVFSHFIL